MTKDNIKPKADLDMLFVCLALSVSGVFIGGSMALFQIAVCAITCLLCEYLAFKVILKKESVNFYEAVCDGVLIALLLSADSPVYIGLCAVAFCVFVCKMPFGGKKYAPFSPVAGGICFVYTLFKNECFNYFSENDTLLSVSSRGFGKSDSLLEMLKNGDSISLNVFDISSILCGNFPSAIGTASVLTLVGVSLFLLIRKKEKLFCFLPFVVSSALIAAAFPRVNSGALCSIIMELSAGSLIFSGILFLCESERLPKSKLSAVLYGVVSGVLFMALRFISPATDSAPFCVLIMNSLYPLFSKERTRVRQMKRGAVNV